MPYLIETDAALAFGKSGQIGVSAVFEYEYMMTQKWVLSPELALDFHTKDDVETQTGKGLSNVEFGLRLGYELKRELMPYVGINWEKKYGNTADFSRAEGEKTEDGQVVVGIRFWF
jgi:copper resistance protein B